jgi:LysR family transcriptional regulator, nitrogen assimilation regulatory protein
MIDHLFAKGGLSLDRLRTFAQIVAASGISKAAPKNQTRQSQYSRQLKELEEFFGVELIQRGNGRFQLTPEGRELFRLVQTQLGGLEDLLRRWSKARVDLRIGAGEAWLHWLVIPALNEFEARCGNVTPVLYNLRHEEIDQWLLDRRLDMGFVRDAKSNLFQCRSIAPVQYRLFIPKIARRPRHKNSTETILRNVKIGLLDESSVSDALLAFTRKRGFELNVCLRATSLIQLVQAVRASYCAAVLPAVARSQFKDGTSEELELRELKQFDHTIIAAQPKQHAMVRPTTANAAKLLLDIIARRN